MPLAILGDLAIGPYLRIRKVSTDGNVTELARIWGRRSFAAGGVMAAIVGVIVVATWFRSRRRSPNTPLQPTSYAPTLSAIVPFRSTQVLMDRRFWTSVVFRGSSQIPPSRSVVRRRISSSTRNRCDPSGS